jgi:hypothetical protein
MRTLSMRAFIYCTLSGMRAKAEACNRKKVHVLDNLRKTAYGHFVSPGSKNDETLYIDAGSLERFLLRF